MIPQASHTLDNQTQGSRSLRSSACSGQVLPQGEVLEGELAMVAAGEREESKQVEQEGDHRGEILTGSEPTDQRLAVGRGFGEGQPQHFR